MANTAVLEDAAGRLERGVGMAADELGRHRLAHWGERGVEAGHQHALEHVALGDDADQPASVHDEQTADLALVHKTGGVQDHGLRSDGQEARALDREDVGDGCHGVLPPGARATLEQPTPRERRGAGRDFTSLLYSGMTAPASIFAKCVASYSPPGFLLSLCVAILI